MIKIYTDGSCINNPGKGGWCALILKDNEEIILKGNEKDSTNNKMELTSVIEALKYIKNNNINSKIELYTDSNYVKNGITVWIYNWLKNNWKTANKKPVLNKELWLELFNLQQNLKIEWNWVKAHNGNHYNEIVDKTARELAQEVIP